MPNLRAARVALRSRRSRDPRGEGGFSLVESLISLGVAAGGTLAVAGLMASGAAVQQHSRDGGRAGMVAMRQLETLRMLPRTDPRVQTGAGGTPAGSLTANVTNYNALITAAPAGRIRVRWLVQQGPAGSLDITVRALPVAPGARMSEARSLVWR